MNPAVKPYAFVACFQPRGATKAPPNVPLPFRRTFETADTTLTLHFAEPDLLTASPDGHRFLLLAGRIYRPEQAATGPHLLAQYARRGADFVRDLSGSFTLLALDMPSGELMLATDRLNTAKLLVSRDSDMLVVSNAMDVHPVPDPQPDPAAVVSYLLGGHVYSARTVFEGVRVLDGGSIYRVRGQQVEQTCYWRYLPSDDHSTPITPALRHELEEALVDAVRVRLHADQPIYVSLSVGYDSRSILGILKERLKIEDVRTFTYTHGKPRPMTNEALAPQIAALCGCDHNLRQSFGGSALDTLRRNGQLGAGMADVCDELDVWQPAEDGKRSLLYTGDTIMPPFNFRLTSAHDALQGAKMADMTAAPWLAPLLGPPRFAEWSGMVRAELDSAWQRAEPNARGASVYKLYDMLRVENPDNRRIFPWREYLTGRAFEIANPLLDERVTEVFMNAPVQARRGRRVFIEVVTAMFPKLFALPRVTATHYASYWTSALAAEAHDLRASITSTSSPLDAFLEPPLLLDLLDVQLASTGRSSARLHAAQERVFHLMRRLHWRPQTLPRPYRTRPVTSPEQLLKRALVLRSAFQHVASRSTAN